MLSGPEVGKLHRRTASSLDKDEEEVDRATRKDLGDVGEREAEILRRQRRDGC